ncbi:transcriptional regulator, partial [Mediterranea sp. An20]|uniref:transcriptional regulator n=1 Tax=Mediterranea sp. An20 TaxID=1965586 RepID=UPI000B3A1789
DLLFVHSTREALDPYVEELSTLQYRYVRGGYCRPMVVGDTEMERFIRAVRSTDSPRYYLPGELTPAMCGRTVRIVGGPLDGYEGRLLSVRGSKVRRLLVEIPNLITAGIEVAPEFIRVMDVP